MNDVSGKHGVTGEASSKASLSLQSGVGAEALKSEPFIPVAYQYFTSKQDWVRNGRYALTGHADYHDTEHDGPEGWRGHHFTAMCFDQKGRRCRIGGDFKRAEEDNAYPIWWIWPDQIVPALKSLALTQKSQIEERSDVASPQVQRLPDTTNTERDAEISRLHREIDKLTAANSRREIEISKLTIRLHQAQEKIKGLGEGR